MFSNVNEEMSFSQRPTTDDGNGSWPTLCKLLPKGLTLWEHPPQTTRIHPSIIILKKFSIRPLRGSHFLLWNHNNNDKLGMDSPTRSRRRSVNKTMVWLYCMISVTDFVRTTTVATMALAWLLLQHGATARAMQKQGRNRPTLFSPKISLITVSIQHWSSPRLLFEHGIDGNSAW